MEMELMTSLWARGTQTFLAGVVLVFLMLSSVVTWQPPVQFCLAIYSCLRLVPRYPLVLDFASWVSPLMKTMGGQ